MNENVYRAEQVVNVSIYVQWLNLVCQMVPDTQSAIFKYSDGIDDQYVSWPKANTPDAQLLESLAFAAPRNSLLTSYTAPLLTVVLPVVAEGHSSVLLALSINAEPDAVEPVKRLVNWSVRWLSELLSLHNRQMQPVSQATQVPCVADSALLQRLLSAPEPQDFLNNTAKYLVQHYAVKSCLLVVSIAEQRVVGFYAKEHDSLARDALAQEPLAEALSSFEFNLLSGDLLPDQLYPFADIPEFEQALARTEKEKEGSHSLLLKQQEQLQLNTCFFNHAQQFLTGSHLAEVQCLLAQCCVFLSVSEHLSEKSSAQMSDKLSGNLVQKSASSIKHKLTEFKSIGLFRWSVAILLLVALLFLPVSYQIPVDTVIEGKVQKSIVSPFDGFIKSAVLKAGDIVEKGHIIAELDDQQLNIEVIRLTSQYQEHEKGYRQALANREYAQANVYKAKLKQAKARLDQVKLQLEQTALKAPIAGMIIQGDLSRRLGSPVSSGDLLFKIAPLNQYRAMLRVQETDIRFIKEGQQGALKLAALPDAVFDISLSKASPLFFEEDNQIVYLAEADLPAAALALLRPGMEGIARVDVGDYSLGWVLTHHFIDWFQVAIWKLWL